MDGKTEVTLAGPTKIDGKHHPIGAVIWVDLQTLAQLQEAGVVGPVAPEAVGAVEPHDDATLKFTKEEFDAAVAAKANEMAGAVFDGALAHLEAELNEVMAQFQGLEAVNAEALARAEKAEKAHADYIAQARADVDRIEARNAELEATISKLTPPPDAPASMQKKPKGG